MAIPEDQGSNSCDEANRLTSVSSALSVPSAVKYSLDGIGNATNVLVSTDGSGILTNAYTFDAAERVSTIDGVSGTFAFDYGQYNGLVAGVSNTASGIRAEYAFDDLDRLTNIVWRNSTNGVLRSFGYQYNSAGMITNVARETSSESLTYGYDSLDRLTSASASYLTASYGWDLAGNPSSRTENGTNTSYTLGTGNKLVSWTGGSYGHDSAGCVTNITRGSDTLSLSWDDRYNLTQVATNGAVAEAYTYGPMGRRVTTVVNGVTNHHVYLGVHRVADLDADGNLVRSFQIGPGLDNWLGMTVHTGATPVVYTYLTDHLGTVHAVADENGDIVESYRYGPHGKVLGVWDGSGTPHAESAIGNRILWQGREYSWTTGLYYFRSRHYDPQTGRFLSRDRVGISGGMNLYQAFTSNPVMVRDAFGTDPDDGYDLGDWFRDAGMNASHGARGILMSPWNLLKGLYGTVQGVGAYAGHMYEDPSGTWGVTTDAVRNLPRTVPAAINQWASDPYAIGSTVGEVGIGFGAAKALQGLGTSRGLQTPGKYFGGRTSAQVERSLRRKFGPPKGQGPHNKSFFNPSTKRTYNLHQDPLHRGGKPHIDIRRRGLPTDYYKDRPFYLRGD